MHDVRNNGGSFRLKLQPSGRKKRPDTALGHEFSRGAANWGLFEAPFCNLTSFEPQLRDAVRSPLAKVVTAGLILIAVRMKLRPRGSVSGNGPSFPRK